MHRNPHQSHHRSSPNLSTMGPSRYQPRSTRSFHSHLADRMSPQRHTALDMMHRSQYRPRHRSGPRRCTLEQHTHHQHRRQTRSQRPPHTMRPQGIVHMCFRRSQHLFHPGSARHRRTSALHSSSSANTTRTLAGSTAHLDAGADRPTPSAQSSKQVVTVIQNSARGERHKVC